MTRPDADDSGDVAVQSAFDELGRISFAEHSLESVLHTVTELAARVLPGEPIISVTILRNGNPRTVAVSGALAAELDEVQYRLGSGPCLSAAATGRPSELLDTLTPADWKEFATVAADEGCGSVLSFPLPCKNWSPVR